MKTMYPPRTLNMAMEWLNKAPRGVALCDNKGSILHANDLFIRFDIPNIKEIIQQSVGLGLESFDHHLPNGSIRLDIVKLEDGYAIVAEDIQSHLSAREEVIANLVAANSDSILESAVKSISDLSGWRWVAVSRFRDDGAVELLSFYDKNQKTDNYIYDLMGTPCEVIAGSDRFAFFPDLVNSFPLDKELQEIGAKVYAGMVYLVNNEPIGRVFAMHDFDDVDVSLIEDLIRISALSIGHKLEAEHAQGIARNAIIEASQDALTEVFNRRAFDRDAEKCIESAHKKLFSDTLLGIIDLDGMKHVNDTMGHKAGDRLLKIFAESLTLCNRPEDRIYRLGGDEFAMIINGAGLSQVEGIARRVTSAVKQTQQKGFAIIDASVGFSSLTEISGDVEDWLQLADGRMYAHKKSKKTPQHK